MMVFDEKTRKMIDEALALYDLVASKDDQFHPKDKAQLEALLNAPESKMLARYDDDGKMVGCLLVSEKRHFQTAALETHSFLKYLISPKAAESGIEVPDDLDIFWMECLCVEPERRGHGIGASLIEEAFSYAADEAKRLPCIVGCGISVDNVAAREVFLGCGMEMIDHVWSTDEFAADKRFGKDFSWNILYRVVR